MGSTSATLLKNNGQLIPQGYDPSTDLYKPIGVRMLGSSEYALMFQDRGYTPSAFEAITVTTSGQSLSSGTYGTAVSAFALVQTAPINFKTNSSAASTAATGNFTADDGDWIELESAGEIAGFRLVMSSTVTPTLVVGYST